jgi:hypothetical protein
MKHWLLRLIRGYQNRGLVFLQTGSCRFSPTCSEYAYQAVDKYGIVSGLWLGLKRIIRCHPWSKGGCDPLPKY